MSLEIEFQFKITIAYFLCQFNFYTLQKVAIKILLCFNKKPRRKAMLLYQKKGETLTVYDMVELPQLEQYRSKMIEQIPESERCFKAVTWTSTPQPIFEHFTGQRKDQIRRAQIRSSKEIVPEDWIKDISHLLKRAPYNSGLIDDYIKGAKTQKSVIQIRYRNGKKYYLLSNDQYEVSMEDRTRRIMTGIIQLPEALWNLQLLGQGIVSPAMEKYAKEQLALYRLTKVQTFSIKDLVLMEQCEIAENVMHRVESKVEQDALVLKLFHK